MKINFHIPHHGNIMFYVSIYTYTNIVYMPKQVKKVMISPLHFFHYYSGFLKIMEAFVLSLYFECFLCRENVITEGLK